MRGSLGEGDLELRLKSTTGEESLHPNQETEARPLPKKVEYEDGIGGN